MKKKFLPILALLLALLMLASACTPAPDPEGGEETTAQTEPESTEPESTEPERETEEEINLPYLIPNPTRIDLSTFSTEMIKAAFPASKTVIVEQCDQGLKFIGRKESRDPGVQWKLSSMFKAAGYPVAEDGKSYVPFTPDEKKVIVFKIQAEWGGAFELFYATEDRNNARGGYSMTEVYGGDSEFFGERVTQYVIFEADETTKGWTTRFNDGCRLDYTNFVQQGDEFLLQKIAFCADRAEAERFISIDKGEPEPIPAVAEGYYVCLYEDRLHLPKNNVKGDVYATLDEAKAACDKLAKYGYRVANEKGEILYAPYTVLQSTLLREAYYIVNYARTEKFKYGDSCTNPGINHRPHYTSCDRLVDWVLYRAGFTDQPLVQGKVVTNLPQWCEEMGFEKITREQDLQPGDIVFVRPSSQGYPLHTYMVASYVSSGKSLRYDHGSDSRIMNKKQPTSEPISYGDAPFMYAYRPVVTEKNNIYYDYYKDVAQ